LVFRPPDEKSDDLTIRVLTFIGMLAVASFASIYAVGLANTEQILVKLRFPTYVCGRLAALRDSKDWTLSPRQNRSHDRRGTSSPNSWVGSPVRK